MAAITLRSSLTRNLTASEVDANFTAVNTELTAATAAVATKQGTLIAGPNITIGLDNTISASSGLATVASTGITDSTTVGRSLVTAVDAAGARTTLGLGTAATSATSAFAAASHATDTGNPHATTKAQVGLGSVDNTADSAKPVSTPQQTALDLKADVTAVALKVDTTTYTAGLALKANLASPTLTGTPAAPTAAAATNTTQLATTAFVQQEIAAKAPLASPTLTGTPLTTTAAVGTNTTQIASCAFVRAELGSTVGANAQDITAATYTGTTLNTYTLNGLTWTMAYNGSGQPSTETAGALVKTYNYTSGNLTSITGAVNAGETATCTLATLPTAANSAPGDRRFVTDVNSLAVGATDSGNRGQVFQFMGATSTGKWAPIGAYPLTRRVGTFAGSLGILSTVLGTAQAVPVTGAAVLGIPLALQVPGNRFKFHLHMHRTGTAAGANMSARVGMAGTSADATAGQVAMTNTVNSSSRLYMDVLITSATTAMVTGTMNSGSNATDAGGAGAQEIALDGTNPLYIKPYISAVVSPDTYSVVYYEIEHVA